MLKLVCPHCAVPVGIFSEPWQSQRKSRKKACPSCGKGVEPAFSAKRYVPLLVIVLLASWLIVSLFGLPFQYLAGAFSLSFGIALLPSVYLRKQS